MNIQFINIKSISKTNKISDKIKELIKSNEELLNDFNKKLSFSYFENNEIILFFKNIKSDISIAFDCDLKNSFIYFINNFINQKKLTIKDSYAILTIAEDLNFSENDFTVLSNSLNWQSNNKAYYYYKEFKNCSILLKEIVYKNKLSIKDAIYFHNIFKNFNYDKLISIIPKNLSFSQTSEILKNLAEYSVKNNKNPKEIYNALINEKEILDAVFKLKYPVYSKTIDKINNYIKDLNFPKNTKINFDKTFEKQEYQLTIKFNDKNDLNDLLNKIKNTLNKNNNKIDLFIHDNLFKE